MNAMKKFTFALERYFERLARARVEALMMPPGRDPWGLAGILARQWAAADRSAQGGARTTIVHPERTVAGHADAGRRVVRQLPARSGRATGEARAETGAVAAGGEPPRSAA